MVVSVTLGFMLYAFIKQSERLKKQKKQLIWSIFCVGGDGREGFVCICMCVFDC